MNIQPTYPGTAEEFLVWNEGREGKREFVRGKVVEMMINVSRNHVRLATRLLKQLADQLGMDHFDIGSADFGVRTDDGIRFPDIFVEAAGGSGRDLATDRPLLVAEILSPSSIADDFGPKAQDYLAIGSLRHYLVLSQDEPRIWLWSRDAEGGWSGPQMIAGTDGPVVLDGLDVTLDMKALYTGVASA
ncbi:Uma2 family endonuclease [Oricola sp.]|uniref:Uma2 family endonuclease n=1 Tax=Oricola sp. TaxID=1979950 RepID=UPI0025E15A44|nr:Uma2 family endonuclease [Oricola sp.]MCI5077545.1 Uma2 family endonuclease [Oricola sp.]